LALLGLVAWTEVSGDAGPAAVGQPGAIKVVHAGGAQVGDCAPVFTARTTAGVEFCYTRRETRGVVLHDRVMQPAA